VWYPDLLALEIPTDPTSVRWFSTFMKTLRYGFEKKILEWFQFHQKLETQVWFWFGS
jgi:hypothetical protein